MRKTNGICDMRDFVSRCAKSSQISLCLHEILSGEGVPEIFVQQGLAAVEGHFIPTMTGSPSTRNPKHGVATEKQTQLQKKGCGIRRGRAEHDGDPRWRRRKCMILYADLLSSIVNWRCYKKETKKFAKGTTS